MFEILYKEIQSIQHRLSLKQFQQCFADKTCTRPLSKTVTNRPILRSLALENEFCLVWQQVLLLFQKVCRNQFQALAFLHFRLTAIQYIVDLWK